MSSARHRRILKSSRVVWQSAACTRVFLIFLSLAAASQFVSLSLCIEFHIRFKLRFHRIKNYQITWMPLTVAHCGAQTISGGKKHPQSHCKTGDKLIGIEIAVTVQKVWRISNVRRLRFFWHFLSFSHSISFFLCQRSVWHCNWNIQTNSKLNFHKSGIKCRTLFMWYKTGEILNWTRQHK